MALTDRIWLVMLIPLLTAGLAGCVGGDDAGTPPTDTTPSEADQAQAPTAGFSIFDAALGSSGQIFEPTEDSPIRLKLLTPSGTQDLEKGTQNVSVLLVDTSGQPAPVTDANMTLKGWMPVMGHGTAPESDPVHAAHGEYHGQTTWSMEGPWMLKMTAVLSDGTELRWDVNVLVGKTSEQDPNAVPVHNTKTMAFEDEVMDLEYTKTWTMPSEAEDTKAFVNITLAEPSLADELTFALMSPSGDELLNKTFTEQEPAAELSVPELGETGAFNLNVNGRAMQTAYTVDVHMAWTTFEAPPTSL